MIRSVAVLLAACTCAGAAAAATANTPPFEYRFQVTSVTEKSTFTKGDATAVTELHLAMRPKAKSIDYYGPRTAFTSNGVASTLLHLTGTITYSGLADDTCNGTVRVDSSRWRPIYASLGAPSHLGTRVLLSAGAGGFPFGTIYPRRSGGCENGATRFWLNDWPKPDSGPGDNLPFAVVEKPGFSFDNRYSERFDDGSAVHWSSAMTVRRIHYRLIDCSHTPYC